MQTRISYQVIRRVHALIIVAILLSASAMAQTEIVLHTFIGGSDGLSPFSGVVFDSAGNLYGTTTGGGSTTACGGFGCGAVYELSPTVGGVWQELILFHFTNSKSGGYPGGNLFLDASGNIFGADLLGGTNTYCSAGSGGLFGCGLVFELSPSSAGYQESVLLALNSAVMGELPYGGVTVDDVGSLYGTAWEGGDLNDCAGSGCGIVFRLSPTESGWRKTILHTFTGGVDGRGPRSSLILDSAGNVYGTTESGGNAVCSCGVVFELSANAGGGWKETVIHSFSGADGDGPIASLGFDAAGNLYGTTDAGGNLSLCNGYGCGVVFELSPTGTGGWKETVLHKFGTGTDGSFPESAVVIDGAGNLYGTTYGGGGQSEHCGQGCGVVYKLSPNSGSFKETVLHRFTGGADGALSATPVTLDAAGNIYGTTESGGNLNSCSPFGCGVVFEIVP